MEGPWSRHVSLEGVRVEVAGAGVFAVSDAFGRFRLEEVPPGEQILVLRCPGYSEFRRAISVEVERPRGLLSFVMTPPR